MINNYDSRVNFTKQMKPVTYKESIKSIVTWQHKHPEFSKTKPAIGLVKEYENPNAKLILEEFSDRKTTLADQIRLSGELGHYRIEDKFENFTRKIKDKLMDCFL